MLLCVAYSKDLGWLSIFLSIFLLADRQCSAGSCDQCNHCCRWKGVPKKESKREFLSWQPLAQEVWTTEMIEYFETRLGKRCSFWHQCPCLGANYREEGLAGGCWPHTGHREVPLVLSGLGGQLCSQGCIRFLTVTTSQEGHSWQGFPASSWTFRTCVLSFTFTSPQERNGKPIAMQT